MLSREEEPVGGRARLDIARRVWAVGCTPDILSCVGALACRRGGSRLFVVVVGAGAGAWVARGRSGVLALRPKLVSLPELFRPDTSHLPDHDNVSID